MRSGFKMLLQEFFFAWLIFGCALTAIFVAGPVTVLMGLLYWIHGANFMLFFPTVSVYFLGLMALFGGMLLSMWFVTDMEKEGHYQ